MPEIAPAELICPNCRGALQMTHGRMASCALHGAEYEVLFDRYADSTGTAEKPRTTLTSIAMCYAHPRQSALFDCAACARPICGTCVLEVRGRHYCGDCAVARAQEPEPALQTDASDSSLKQCPMCGLNNSQDAARCTCGYTFGILNIAPPSRRAVPENLVCVQHPQSRAVAACRICSNGVCSTCDFQFAGNVHVCPTCVEKDAGGEISPRRTRLSRWALGLAIYSTIMMALLFLGVLHRMVGVARTDSTANTIIGNMIFLPTIAGTALAFASFDRKLRNPGIARTAMVWNSIMLGIYLILIFIGLSR